MWCPSKTGKAWPIYNKDLSFSKTHYITSHFFWFQSLLYVMCLQGTKHWEAYRHVIIIVSSFPKCWLFAFGRSLNIFFCACEPINMFTIYLHNLRTNIPKQKSLGWCTSYYLNHIKPYNVDTKGNFFIPKTNFNFTFRVLQQIFHMCMLNLPSDRIYRNCKVSKYFVCMILTYFSWEHEQLELFAHQNKFTNSNLLLNISCSNV